MEQNKIKQEQNNLEHLLQMSKMKQYARVQKREKRFAVIYTRVSSMEQAENNSSLATQLKLCTEYAARQGLIVKETFGGTYESAKTDGRKEFTRMLSFVRRDKDIAYIIVYNYDRFSRTGPLAAKLSDDLRRIGVTVKSVLQDIDSSTASGRLQENIFHVFNHFDNDTKSERTATNTREVMLKGYWPYMTPMGYKNLKPKHRACDHQYVITDEGKLIKKAFELKAEGILTNQQIVDKLSLLGLRLTVKNFRWILSNAFYAGYVTGNLTGGKLIKGKHPAIIDLNTFLKANNLLQAAVNAGIPKKIKQEELPLKVFVRDEQSRSPFTGYIKKGNWYYKARGKGVGVNISARELNGSFEQLLKQFEYKKHYKQKLKKLLYEKLRSSLSRSLDESVQLKKQITEARNLLDKIEERFATGEINHTLYEKFSSKYREQIHGLEKEIKEKSFDSSNLEMAVEKGLEIAENLSQAWVTSNYEGKQKLQYLVFPEGIEYNKKSGTLRTQRVNNLFAEIEPLKRLLEKNENGNSSKSCHLSDFVPRTGLLS